MTVEDATRTTDPGQDAGASDRGQTRTPTLSVVLATREPWLAVARNLEPLAEEIRAVDGELIVVGVHGEHVDAAPPVRVISTPERDLMELHSLGVRAARGAIVAMAEDHAAPEPGWCQAVLRGHRDHPEAAAVVGCLINATDDTVAGRANFLTFAAPFTPPMPTLRASRPPPLGVLSFKRSALAPVNDRPGRLEADLVPRLFADGCLAVDDRVRILHYQDHGALWAVRNAYWVARAGYGYAEDRRDPRRRREVLRWIPTHMPQRIWHEARAAYRPVRGEHGELAIVACCAVAATVGAMVGTFAGPGEAAGRSA